LSRVRALRGYWKVAKLTGLAWIMNLIAVLLRQEKMRDDRQP